MPWKAFMQSSALTNSDNQLANELFMQRENISFRLQSGRKRYIEKGGKLGRKVGSVKTAEQIRPNIGKLLVCSARGLPFEMWRVVKG